MKKAKRCLWFFLPLLVLLAVLSHLPAAFVCPFLDDASAISAVELEFDTGKTFKFYILSDPEEIDTLRGFLTGTSFRLNDPFFNGIRYDDTDDDSGVRVIGISFGKRTDHIDLKSDGSVYVGVHGYKGNGESVSKLYQYLITTYFPLAE